ncbi:GrdX family protein [Desulfovibrio sp. 86]|uniref:GrdX family protein n=1 Tax=Desulfovibrio sp. 86 TaxID=2666132 RepID=UPI0015D415E1|nr:GrdX family protein [Desulfovibrio sp. 86]
MRAARDQIHQGWRLANHPLYGNFLPRQMPYRSLILSSCAQPSSEAPALVDITSLELIEQAQARYDAAAVLAPIRMDSSALRDCAFVDVELLRATIESLGCSIKSLLNLNGRHPAPAPGVLSHHKEM